MDSVLLLLLLLPHLFALEIALCCCCLHCLLRLWRQAGQHAAAAAAEACACMQQSIDSLRHKHHGPGPNPCSPLKTATKNSSSMLIDAAPHALDTAAANAMCGSRWRLRNSALHDSTLHHKHLRQQHS